MTELWMLAILLFILVILDLTTSGAQTAFLHASLPRLLYQRDPDGRKNDSTALLVQASIRTQSSLSLVRLLMRFLIAGATLVILNKANLITWWGGLGGLVLSALVLFILEWVVDGVVLQDATGWALRLTLYTRIVTILLSPFVRLVQLFFGSRQTILGVAGTISVTEDDLRTLVDAGPPEEGQLEQDERKMIHSIFELGSTLVREIMVPRIDMLAVDVNTSLPEAVDMFMNSGHSRLPVYEETVDHIVGLLYAKDLLHVWQEKSKLDSLRPLLREAYFVPEAKKVDELLAELQRQRVHMAIVVDEYGGIAGLVTLEDIVEEIVGEIQDEYDQAEELPYEEVADGEYIFQGRIGLDDFNEVTNSHLPKEEADTLAGFIYSRMGRVPSNGETLEVENLTMTIEQVSGRRIRKVHVQSALPMSPSDEKVNNGNG